MFYRLPVTSAECIIGNGKYSDAGIILSYDDDDFSQGYAQINEIFRGLSKNDILQPYISDDDFGSSNAGLLKLVIVYLFSIHDISKFSQLPNQSKWSSN